MKVTAKWILTKFQKLRGDNTDARSWDELSPRSQLQLLERIDLLKDEVPVVAMTAPPNPVVITTMRVIWRSNGSPRQIMVTELASVKSPEFLHKSKLDMSKLVVTTHSGQEHLLVTAQGDTLFILWNLLLMFTRVPTGSLDTN